MVEIIDIDKYCKNQNSELISELSFKMLQENSVICSVFRDYNFTLKIKKNKKYVVPIPRNHDIISNFSFSYVSPKNYIDFRNLPNEINDKIKSFIYPFTNVQINLCIDNDIDKFSKNNIAVRSSNMYLNDDIVNTSINLPIDPANIDPILLDDFVNGLPMCAIIYKSVFLTIRSDRDVNLDVNFRGIMMDTYRRLLLNKTNLISYKNKSKLKIGLGLIVKSKNYP